MKIDRRSFIAGSSSAMVFARSQLSLSATAPAAGTVAVYTTADKTEHRLSPTSTLTPSVNERSSLMSSVGKRVSLLMKRFLVVIV